MAGQAFPWAGQNNVPATHLFVGVASRGWGTPRRGWRAVFLDPMGPHRLTQKRSRGDRKSSFVHVRPSFTSSLSQAKCCNEAFGFTFGK